MATHEFTLDIRAPVAEVFAAWRRVESFPCYMPHVLEVRRSGPRRTCWRVRVGGQELSWEAETTELELNRKIAWQSREGLENEGAVHLEATPEGTRVKVIFNYNPPYGVAGDVAEALAMGGAFERAVREDLAHMKDRLEALAASRT